MHVVVSKKDLLRMLQRCQEVADRKSTMPVLGNVLLEVVGPDQLRVAATDLYLAVSAQIPAEVEKGGSVAVGARDFYERVKRMPEGKLSVSTDDGTSTTIRAAGQARRYTVHGVPGEEFPELPKPETSASEIKLNVATLAELIQSTHFSISNDETRLHLSSALFECEGDTARMVTTDGHRLSKMEVKAQGLQSSASMLIPHKGIQELRRLCEEAKGDAAETLSMRQSGPNAFFEVAGFQFSVKLVDAQFPPYEQVIPNSTEHHVKAPRNQVADALDAVSLAASDRTGGVKLTLGANTLRFSSESPESGDGFDEVPVEYADKELTIGFNARYFLDVLRAMTSEDIVIGINGELDPATIAPADQPKGTEYLAVVMPMRI